MADKTQIVEPTRSLRAFTSKVTYSNTLISTPTIYDLAPEYLLQTYKEDSGILEQSISKRIQNQEMETISNKSTLNDVKIAVQHIAPIGLNIVRLGAIGLGIVSLANPVTLILGAPALLITGKNTLENLKRAFSDDPKIRELVQKASEYEKRGDLENAESILKDALDVNVNPDNMRNRDIYFQMALINLKMKNPRKALIHLAEASVLFKEDDKLTMDKDRNITISKRGYIELLACASIDSFMISDPAGLKEWQEISQDFSRSAIKRFEYYIEKKDSGVFFGIFGKSEESVKANNALIAKVKFLQAKIDAKKLLGSNEKRKIHPALQEGVKLIQEDTTLTNEERAVAFLEQAQFYYSAATKSPETAAEMVLSALMLTKAASQIYKEFDIEKQIFTSAESISFLLDFVPKLKVENPEQKKQITEIIREELESLIETINTVNINEKGDYLLWAFDKIYKLSDRPEDKLACINKSIALSKERKNSISLFYSTLRKTFLEKNSQSISDLLEIIETITGSDDTNLKAYGYKYKAEMLQNKNKMQAAELFEKAGEFFKQAAEECKKNKKHTPFMVQGHPVLHSWKESYFVYLVLSAHCFINSKSQDKLKNVVNLSESTIFSSDRNETKGIIKTLKAAMKLMEKDNFGAENYLKDAVAIFNSEGRKDLILWAKGIIQINEDSDQKEISHRKKRSDDINGLKLSGMDDYEKIKTKTLCVFEKIKPFCDEKSSNSINHINETENKLKDCKFTIAVVGEFSTGKSTFINALLGEKVLPHGALPTTSAVNMIKYSSDKYAIVNFRNNPSEKISIENIRNYITEKNNPGNTKEVKNVEIYYPLELLRNGIVILDTPGLGSLHKEHQEITYSVIPSCDAVILLTTSVQPYSESTDQFLVNLKNEIGNKIFFVLNMIDTLSQGNLLEQQDFIKRNASKIINDIKIFPLSSYFALVGKGLRDGILEPENYKDNEIIGGNIDPQILLQNSRFLEFERDLYKYLVNNKGRIILENINSSLKKVLNDILAQKKALVISFDKELSVVQSECAALSKKAKETQGKFDVILTNISEDLKDIQNNLMENINKESGELKKTILDYIDKTDINLLKATGVEKAISTNLENWVKDVSKNSISEIERTVDKNIEKINQVSAEFYNDFDEIFNNGDLNAPPCVRIADIKINTQGFLDFAGSFGIGVLAAMIIGGPVSILVGLLGGPYFSSFLQSKRNEKAKNELKDSIEKEFSNIILSIKETVRSNIYDIQKKTMKTLKDHTDIIILKKEEELKNLLEKRELQESEILPVKKKAVEDMEQIKYLETQLNLISKKGDFNE